MSGENEMPQEIVEKADRALNDYGNERDWQKMRSDEMAEAALAALSPDDLKGLLEHATGKRVVVLSDDHVQALVYAADYVLQSSLEHRVTRRRAVLHSLREARSALASPRELGQDDG